MTGPVAQLFDDGTASERRKLSGMYALLIGFSILAWAWAFVEFAGRPPLLGTALLAYIFGLRHAVDADHIAAIDNVVRKLMQEDKRPLAVGLFFSLGHSTLVALATIVVAFGAATLQSRFGPFRDASSTIGTSVSAVFLLAIAIVNIAILRNVWSNFQHLRRSGHLGTDHHDIFSAGSGLLARLFHPLFRIIEKSWHMYPLGLLFALSFDTATEIGLLGISASQVSQGMSPFLILIFPALFTAGMTLIDTTDGVFMVGVYGWAFVNPARRLWYNLTITAVSILVAGLIGGIETLGLLATRFNLAGTFWNAVIALNENSVTFGCVVIGLFVASWISSALIYHWKGLGDLVEGTT